MLTMTLVLETLASGNISASILEFLQYRVESGNREDAIVQIRADAQALLDRIEVLPLQLNSPHLKSPWIKYAGMVENDLDFAEIASAIRAEREVDGDLEVDPSVYMR